jgi:hypothetical protein
MQNLAVDEAGNTWELDAAGNAVRMIAPASSGGKVFSLPPNPKDLRQEARQSAADQRADRASERADRQMQLAEEAAARAARESELKEGGTAKQRAEWKANLGNIGLLEKTVADLRKQYKDHFEGKGLQSIKEEFAPARFAPEFGVFDTTAQSMLADMAKAKGLTAQQFNTPQEQRMFFEPLIPKRGDTDEVIETKLNNLERMIATGRQTTEQQLGLLGDSAAGKAQQQADNEVPDPTTGGDLKPPPNDPNPDAPPPENGGDIAATDGKSRIVRDPRVSAQVDAMINAGASKAMIDAVLKRQGFPTINAGDLMQAQKWMKENPGKKYFGADPTRVEDLNFGQRVLADQNVAPVAAGMANYANMATAGTVGALAGEEGQGALNAAAALHPTASTIGNLAGGVTGALGAEAAIAAKAPAALAKFAPRIADALYGGLSGFNAAQEGEGLEGALLGAGAGLAGGYLGEKAMRGVGAVAKGVTDPAVEALRARGIPLTVGQVVGNGGMIGQGIKKMEDAMTSVPFVGNMVEARRMEGLRGFNEAAFRDAAAPGANVDQVGAAGMGQLRQGVTDAYGRALDPVHIDPLEPQFGADMLATRNAASRIPEVDGARTAATEALDHRITGGVDPITGLMPGRNFQEAYRGLARTGRERANRDYGHEISQVMRQGQDTLGEALERQNPGAFDQFLEANAANRRANVLADALKNAGSQADELVTPAQLNRADITSTSRLEGKINSAAGNRPFYDLASAGQSVLPSRVPDSGTWTRALVGGGGVVGLGGIGGMIDGVEGAGAGAGLGLGATLLLAAGGSKPAQKMLVDILASRPDLARKIGSQIVDKSGIGGWTGAGALTPLLIGQ